MATKNPMKNKSNGEDAEYADNCRKKATAPKGRYNQPKGENSKVKKSHSSPEKTFRSDTKF